MFRAHHWLSLVAVGSVLMSISKLFAQDVQPQHAADTIRTLKQNEVVIEAERPYSAASDKSFRQADFDLRPRNSAQDMLRLVPGLVLAQHAGGGKAEQIFLRGFDCDHGTDVNVSVDDAPVNMISHGHGQGYADLHYIIPETIQNLDVMKGPYLAQYGDLATAGVVAFHTMDSLPDNSIRLEGGQFDAYRALGLVKGPQANGINSYFGADLFSTQGYFDNAQDFKRLILFGKGTAQVGEEGKLSASLTTFTSEWNASGQIPERAVDLGLIDQFGSLDPSEGGNTRRSTGIVSYTSGGSSPFTVTGSLTNYHFQLFSDFTFFLQDSVHGDEREQTDDRTMLSLRAEKSSAWELGEAIMRTTYGANLRSDAIAVGLYHDTARTRLNTIVNANVDEQQIGPYLQQEIVLPWAQFLLGARADYIGVNVTNLMSADSAPSGNRQQFVISPKASVTIPLSNEATLFLNSGYGFHSNDARVIVENPASRTIPRAFGAEIGSRYGHPGDFFSGSVALWQLDLASELVYNGDEGTYDPQGRTRRQGIDLEARIQPVTWLVFGGDATISHGSFLDSAVGHNYIPLAPTITLTGNVVAHFDQFSAAMRLRNVGSRPANTDNSVIAEGYSIFDLSMNYHLGAYEFSVNVENLFNVSWHEAQFDTDTRLKINGVLEPRAIDQLDFTSGTPRSIRGGVTYHF
jgi:hypothetical protein